MCPPSSFETLEAMGLELSGGAQGILFDRRARVKIYSAGSIEQMITINPDADMKTNDRIAAKKQEDFRVDYRGSKTISKNGSSCTITIYELGQEARDFITGISKDKPRIVLETGYDGRLEILFYGHIGLARHQHNSPNWETTLICDGGIGTAKNLRLKTGYNAAKSGKATSDILSTVVEEALRVLKDNGLNITGTAKLLLDRALVKFRAGMKGYAKGLSFDGSALDILDNIIGKEDGAISVDNGEINIIDFDETAMMGYIPLQIASILNAGTGLTGFPIAINGGGVGFQCLLLPSIKPGSVVDVNGDVQVITKVDYDGSNKDGQNVMNCEAKPVKTLINELKAYKLQGIFY